jgi:hypothetical protein
MTTNEDRAELMRLSIKMFELCIEIRRWIEDVKTPHRKENEEGQTQSQ